jgi:hypothetical protein
MWEKGRRGMHRYKILQFNGEEILLKLLVKFYEASPSYVSSQNMVHQNISLTFLEDISGFGAEFPEGDAEFDDRQNLACVEN